MNTRDFRVGDIVTIISQGEMIPARAVTQADCAACPKAARLGDIEDDFRATLTEVCDAGDDRVHCACVPHLRRGLRDLEEKLAAAGAHHAGDCEVLRVPVVVDEKLPEGAVVIQLEKPPAFIPLVPNLAAEALEHNRRAGNALHEVMHRALRNEPPSSIPLAPNLAAEVLRVPVVVGEALLEGTLVVQTETPCEGIWWGEMRPGEKISVFCRRTHAQFCHGCDDLDCGDNTSEEARTLRGESKEK